MPPSDAPAASCTAYGSVPIRALPPGPASTMSATDAVAWSRPPISSNRPSTATVAGNWTPAGSNPSGRTTSDTTAGRPAVRRWTGRPETSSRVVGPFDADPQPTSSTAAPITGSKKHRPFSRTSTDGQICALARRHPSGGAGRVARRGSRSGTSPTRRIRPPTCPHVAANAAFAPPPPSVTAAGPKRECSTRDRDRVRGTGPSFAFTTRCRADCSGLPRRRRHRRLPVQTVPPVAPENVRRRSQRR